ncbi:hypothetical protein BHE74_00027914 [Ensete ventricosum]|nr:hypothetical protein BHE74_00027914 [Ensete ventricosum]
MKSDSGLNPPYPSAYRFPISPACSLNEDDSKPQRDPLWTYASSRGLDDVVGACREFARSLLKVIGSSLGAHREFVGGRPRFGRCCRELAENSLKVYRKVRREFADRLFGAR